MAWLLPYLKVLKNKVTEVSPQFWRVHAVLVSCQTSKLLLIISYCPNDDLHANGADNGELCSIGNWCFAEVGDELGNKSSSYC